MRHRLQRSSGKTAIPANGVKRQACQSAPCCPLLHLAIAALLCLSFPLLTAHAQSDAGTVTGQVLCADTLKPARFASVSLVPEFSSSGINQGQGRRGGGSASSTGADGTFVLKNVSAGVYDVQVVYPGYVQPLRFLNMLVNSDPATQQPWLDMLTKVTVQAGQTATATAMIYRGADLTGTVSYDDGSPSVGLVVSALLAIPANGSANAGTNLTAATANLRAAGIDATTDDRGRFHLSGLAEGTYTLEAIPRRSGNVFPVYLGNTNDRTQAELLTVKAGSDRQDLLLQIDITNLHRVRGVLAGTDNHAIAGAGITLVLAAGGTDSIQAITTADGTFTFQSVPDGKFILSSNGGSDPESHVTYKSTTTQITVSGTDISDVVLTPAP